VTKYSTILGLFHQPWPGVSPTAILNEEKALGTRLMTCYKRAKFHHNLVPKVFSLFKMAAAREKTLAHSRSGVSNEDGDVFKMAATANRVRRTGHETLR